MLSSESEAPKSYTTQKAEKSLTNNCFDGLTYKQQLKQDAVLWAEFLYSEYKRKQAQAKEAQSKPTHYDDTAT